MKQAAIHDSLRHDSTIATRQEYEKEEKKQKSLHPASEPDSSEISTDSAGSESPTQMMVGNITSDEVTKMDYLDSSSRHDAMWLR